MRKRREWTRRPAKVSEYGVGTVLTDMLVKLSVTGSKRCGCKALAAKMNRIGLEGVRRQREAIVSQLKQNAIAQGLGAVAEFADTLLDAAIEQAQEASKDAGIGTNAVRLNLPPRSFNGSLLERGGKRFLVYRYDWKPSTIRAVELNAEWQPCGESRLIRLPVVPETAGMGGWWEDPRIVLHEGRVFVAYAGISKQQRCSLCLAEIDDEFKVVSHLAPQYAERRPSEKNWSFFSYGGELYCVYRTAPLHIVLRLEGETLIPFSKTAWNANWSFGELRGGASPVLHNGEWYSFIHGTRTGNERLHTAGLYTFSAEPPFAPKRWIPRPLLIPGKGRPGRNHANCVFPCGAIRGAGGWHVSYGMFDEWSEVAFWTDEAIESALVAV